MNETESSALAAGYPHNSQTSASSSSRSSADLAIQTDFSDEPTTRAVSESEPLSPAPRRFVHFNLEDPNALSKADSELDEEEGNTRWTHEEDFMESSDEDDFGVMTGGGGRAPLLTNMAAPSVLAAEMDFNELTGSNESKSGMKMAFMNMANSIM